MMDIHRQLRLGIVGIGEFGINYVRALVQKVIGTNGG